LNPFATEEDNDGDDGEVEGDFTIGDLEVEEEGKGHLPPGTGLVGEKESLEGIDLDGMERDKNVGVPSDSSVVVSPFSFSLPLSSPNSRASFPTLWPFGGSSQRNKQSEGEVGEEEWSDRNHFRGAQADDDEQSSDEDSDDGYGSGKFGGDGQGGKRRLSVTTEAKRRTSLEDDDDEEVVHVGMAELREEGAVGGKVVEGRGEGMGDDEDLVEIQHAEMQGVEAK
jgi:hypothetical protein